MKHIGHYFSFADRPPLTERRGVVKFNHSIESEVAAVAINNLAHLKSFPVASESGIDGSAASLQIIRCHS